MVQAHDPVRKSRPRWIIPVVGVVLVLAFITFLLTTGFNWSEENSDHAAQPTPPSVSNQTSTSVLPPGQIACDVKSGPSNKQMPVWNNDVCQYVSDTLLLLDEGASGSLINISAYTITILESGATTMCGSYLLSGDDELWLLWCGERFVVVGQSLAYSANNFGLATTLGAITATYSDMVLAHNNVAYSSTAAACVAGDVMSSLRDQHVLTTPTVLEIRDAYFYEPDESRAFTDAYEGLTNCGV